MIIKEFYLQREDGVNLYRHYSDNGLYIRQDQTGNEYDEAIDIENAPYTYTETDKPIEGGADGQATEQDLYDALAELGVSE